MNLKRKGNKLYKFFAINVLFIGSAGDYNPNAKHHMSAIFVFVVPF